MASPTPLGTWVITNYSEPINTLNQLIQIAYVAFAFCAALLLGGLKALLVGSAATAVLILGNVGVILALFPAHVAWTVYSVIKTNHFNAALKLAIVLALPLLFGLWLAFSIFGSILVGVGYGFFTPWLSTFEAFRQDGDKMKFKHCVVDGTWGTIKGSCTVVRDFADICYHSFPLYLKELRASSQDHQSHSMRLRDVPACILVGLMGMIVDLPFYALIALVKSPFMLFKGWHKLLHDLITREGIFIETICVPIAGLGIFFWPLIVVGSVILAIVSSIFVGLYGSIVVYQERSFQRGIAYVVAMVAEFDEYTNDWLYLREGSIFPKPRYRKRKPSNSSESSVRPDTRKGVESSSGSSEAPGFLPKLAPSRSVRETIHEVHMVQIWADMMKSCEMSGRELIEAKVITAADLIEWLKAKGTNQETIGLGLPSYSLLHSLLYSIKAGSVGLFLSTGIEVTPQNRPQDRVMDWFFHPVLVLKEQIRVLQMSEQEVNYLEKLVLFVNNIPSEHVGYNGFEVPKDALRVAQIKAIGRRLTGITRNVSKFPTYRRTYRQVVKLLIGYCLESDGSHRSHTNKSVSSTEILPADV